MMKKTGSEISSISALQGKALGPHKIDLKLKPMKSRGGWTHFSLFLKTKSVERKAKKYPAGEEKRKLILEGILSEGGRDVIGWIEVGNYFPISYLKVKDKKSKKPDLVKTSLDQELVQLLSRCVPPGGHFMFAYETFYESPLHEETLIGLSRNIPPVCTPQGGLLFYSGFRFIKNWYLSEGGFEGPSKLWAEKPLDEDDLARLDLKSFYEILSFLSRNPDHKVVNLELAARKRALEIMAELTLGRNISPLREKILSCYRQGLSHKGIGKAARQACQLIRQTYKKDRIKEKQIKENLFEIYETCLESFKRY
jgi:hypothetical protein